MAARIAAVIVAIGLIAAAIAYRTGGGNGGNPNDDGTPVAVVCSTELATLCQTLDDETNGLEVRVEPAWVTFDRLSDGERAGVDVWLAAGRWGEMVNGRLERNQQEALFQTLDPLASAQLALVAYKDDVAKLPCASAATWACIGEAAASGALRLGSPDPDREATGISLVAAATGGHVGTPEFAANDLDVAHEARVTELGRRLAEHRGTSLETMLATPALLDAFAALGPVLAPVVVTAAARDQVSVLVPTPVATITVTPAVANDRGRDVIELLRGIAERHLGEYGWDVEPPPAPENDGLPSPGVLEALRELI